MKPRPPGLFLHVTTPTLWACPTPSPAHIPFHSPLLDSMGVSNLSHALCGCVQHQATPPSPFPIQSLFPILGAPTLASGRVHMKPRPLEGVSNTKPGPLLSHSLLPILVTSGCVHMKPRPLEGVSNTKPSPLLSHSLLPILGASSPLSGRVQGLATPTHCPPLPPPRGRRTTSGAR